MNRKSILTEDEKVILKNLSKEYKYIARDKNGDLKLFKRKPEILFDIWYDTLRKHSLIDTYQYLNFYNHLFKFIRWEDETPYKIKELLNANA